MPRHLAPRAFAILAVTFALAASVERPTLQAAETGTPAFLTVPGRSSATPSLAAAGTFVVVAWGGTDAAGKADVFVATSGDGGVRFSPPVRVNRVIGTARLNGEFPPRVAVREVAGGHEVTVLWNAIEEGATLIKRAHSEDGGRTFVGEAPLQKAGAAGDRGWPALAVDGKGQAHAIWLDHRGLADMKAQTAGDHAAHTNEADTSARSGLYYSSGGGERELTTGVCYCCKTALVSDGAGTLFAAWRQVYAGNVRDIAFTTSRDGGRTFTPPQRVSEDQWVLQGCPDDGPAMAVDTRSTVHVVWPTVTAEGGEPSGAIFYSRLADGARFATRTRVPTMGSPKPMHPQIAVGGEGELFVAWEESRNGVRRAFVRTVGAASAGTRTFGPVVELGSDGPSVYPVLVSTGRGMLAAWTDGKPGATRIALQPVGAR